ncbi:hypothetical protein Ddc_21575 [Ditylenchus destructor]|nr:hypothetical protein Ddc_21575 [Ditylenchus destructor]
MAPAHRWHSRPSSTRSPSTAWPSRCSPAASACTRPRNPPRPLIRHPPAAVPALPGVVVKGASEVPLTVGGFGDTPIAKLPMQASIVSSERMTDRGLISLAGLTSLDASVGDAYNSAGYVSYLKIRGFDLDNRFNYRPRRPAHQRRDRDLSL